MKNITKLILFAALLIAPALTKAQCITYFTPNVGWGNSEYYKIIDIDAEKLTSTTLPRFHNGTAYPDGAGTSDNFGAGSFTTPILYTTDNITYTPTSVLWPVQFYKACFESVFYNSARTKVDNGSAPSGTIANCTLNNNSIVTSPIWDKKGFIELCRDGATTAAPTVSQHGYIVLNDLPAVERIQWSFSSTSYKRGVKMDIKYGTGAWQPLHWEATNVTQYATFAEQGYQFEEMIGQGDNPDSKISIRFRIWDGDSIHCNLAKGTDPCVVFTPTNTPLGQQQTVRIHQIKVFSGIIPTTAPSAVAAVNMNSIKIYLSDKNIVLSEEANVELYSIEGRNVYKGFTKQIDASSLSKGIYIIKATDAQGKIQNKKIAI